MLLYGKYLTGSGEEPNDNFSVDNYIEIENIYLHVIVNYVK
jgi:hypothetical protein